MENFIFCTVEVNIGDMSLVNHSINIDLKTICALEKQISKLFECRKI